MGVIRCLLDIDSLIKGLTSDKNSVLSGVQNVGYMTAMELLHLTSKSVELLVSRQQLYFVKNWWSGHENYKVCSSLLGLHDGVTRFFMWQIFSVLLSDKDSTCNVLDWLASFVSNEVGLAFCVRWITILINQVMINLARKLRISAFSWCESFSKAKVW